ncbi:MAG: metallophosphoesterase [Rhodobacteraceae bacterium]|nr:metallophosphoesterase [Paracoccaceae bacterium]
MAGFRIWTSACSHLATDLAHGRRSFAEALAQSEEGGALGGPPFAWDIALHLGDLSGTQPPPTDAEGPEVVAQLSSGRRHPRSSIYTLAGNHDASGPGEEAQWWFRKWVDPLGTNAAVSGVDRARMPFAVEGAWDRYRFRVGNLLVLMMSDRNDGGPPSGRGARGGYPSGRILPETFDWWVDQIESNRDRIILSCHHYMLRETTAGSGPWEGFHRDATGKLVSLFHGYFPGAGEEGASYLYWCGDRPDAQVFERYLAAHPGAVDLWLGAHTHTVPDLVLAGRSLVERKWGVTFANVSALTKYHVGKLQRSAPMSRLLTFEEGRDTARLQCYLHTADYAPQGWFAPAEVQVPLRHPFRR